MLLERQSRGQALERYGAISDEHRWEFDWLWRAQRTVRFLHGAPMDALTRLFARPRVSLWAFERYLDVCPPSAVLPAPPAVAARSAAVAA